MNILIIGGSGILSTDFTRRCLDAGHAVYMVNRGKRTAFIDNRATLIIADWRNECEEQLKEKLECYRFDVVIDFLTFNVEQLKKTLRIVKDKFQQYIFISSATAYKDVDDGVMITEDMPIGNEKWSYADNKSKCEKYLEQTDVCYIIIRPYVTFGDSRIPFQIIPDGYQFTLLARIIEEKPILLYNQGEAICTLTSTRDFAEALFGLLLNSKAYKEAFHITSNNVQTWNEVYMEICRLLNKPSYPISMTQSDVHRYFPEFESILNGDKGRNMIFDNSKILATVGEDVFQTNLRTGMEASIKYYFEHEYMQGIDYKWDGKCDYFLRKQRRIKMHHLKEYCKEKSNSKLYYYFMTITPLRIIYDGVRSMKRILHNGGRNG